MDALRVSVLRCWWPLLWLLGTVLVLAPRVSAVEVYAPEELFVEFDTEARLPCTFRSTEVTSSMTFVLWQYKPESGGSDFARILYYTSGTTFSEEEQFKGRISWAGDLNKRDASIKIQNMQFKDNGTYECAVVNPPDLKGSPKRIKVRVVEKENLPGSNVPLLVGIICGVIGFLLLVAILTFTIVICKKKRSRKAYKGCSTTESLMTPVKQPPRKSTSDPEAMVTPIPSGALQGPVIYAQLDHSGTTSNQIKKSETVVYSDIRRIC
ncbi:myelin protein zero-like protein 1 isoform X2 [Spea bombifrons]|uniref:myelin protein zero-like protein 1 isoform X2 n=1 Tax=Spea bombifrons TaxID=233779 RepID=UPI00234B8682|nr:myelin protein zero-like protein 1 isoform X2 [Spea bombifrons]